MTAWGVTGLCVLVAVGSVACSGGADGSSSTTTSRERASSTTTTTAPERPASTTTTAYDPAAVEGQVEAAYLRSWDVYADAVYDLELDEQALQEVYAEDALAAQVSEIRRRIADNTPSLVRVDHEYTVGLVDPGTANVVDQFVNHQVRIDPITKEPIEADPNERSLLNFKMRLLDGVWKVVFIERLSA